MSEDSASQFDVHGVEYPQTGQSAKIGHACYNFQCGTSLDQICWSSTFCRCSIVLRYDKWFLKPFLNNVQCGNVMHYPAERGHIAVMGCSCSAI